MPFDFQAIPEVGLPLAGFFPQTRRMDPRAAAQAAWLNQGGRTAPVTATAPSLQDLNEWTDEDWQIAVMSGADPIGVREAFDRYRGAKDEQAFIEGLGQIDWRSPAAKSEVGKLITKLPRGVTQKGLGIMQLMDKLEGTEKDTYRPQVAELGTEYLQAYDNALKGGADRESALAAATTLRHKNSLAEKAKIDVRNKFVEAGGDLDKFEELSGKYGTDWAAYRDYLNKNKPLAKLEAAERKALTEAFENYNATLAGVDDAATDEAKIAAFTKAHGRTPQTKQDWEQAYNLVKAEQTAPALGALADLVDLYEGKVIPDAVTRLVRPAGSGIPATTPVAPALASAVAPSLPTPVTTPVSPSAATAPSVVSPTPAPAAPVLPVSQADLKRDDRAPISFETLAQQVAQSGEAERKKLEAEYLSRQKVTENEGNKWEQAKLTLLKGISPDMIPSFSASPTQETFNSILQGAGVDNSKPAFHKANGQPVSWYEVLTLGLARDPRIRQMQDGASVPQRSTKTFSNLWGGKGS